MLLIVMILSGLSIFLYIEEEGNFHCITNNEAYRSAQLDRDELIYYIQQYKIKSILNLRGKNPKKKWYKEEINVCKQYKVNHYDLHLSAQSKPSKSNIKKLIKIFQLAQLPILIHCKSGADRSGLVAAMWKFYIDKTSKAEASKQLSIFYGHLPFGPTSAMDKFFDNWAKNRR